MEGDKRWIPTNYWVSHQFCCLRQSLLSSISNR